MFKHNRTHVWVTEKGKVVSVVSLRDVFSLLANKIEEHSKEDPLSKGEMKNVEMV